MSDPMIPTNGRPFPWYCPKCRRKEVRRATIPYTCQRLLDGKQVTIALENLAVPRCDNCGELVFDYEAEEQINRAVKLRGHITGVPLVPAAQPRTTPN